METKFMVKLKIKMRMPSLLLVPERVKLGATTQNRATFETACI